VQVISEFCGFAAFSGGAALCLGTLRVLRAGL
jgi:hypothetical protein